MVTPKPPISIRLDYNAQSYCFCYDGSLQLSMRAGNYVPYKDPARCLPPEGARVLVNFDTDPASAPPPIQSPAWQVAVHPVMTAISPANSNAEVV